MLVMMRMRDQAKPEEFWLSALVVRHDCLEVPQAFGCFVRVLSRDPDYRVAVHLGLSLWGSRLRWIKKMIQVDLGSSLIVGEFGETPLGLAGHRF